MDKCLLSGREIVSFGSKEDKYADGVRTNIGPVHRACLNAYDDLIGDSIDQELRTRLPSDLKDQHVRKRALKILQSVKT